ncbi:MAG: hypothetical protein NTX61_15110 [Bacteroidetes bacterium]|nr:hypothetical protein [Bacteroidota bacterium]
MELNIQYVNDKNGQVKAVQIPIKDWKWLHSKFITFSKELSLRDDLTKAFDEVRLMQTGKMKKQSLGEFLNEI